MSQFVNQSTPYGNYSVLDKIDEVRANRVRAESIDVGELTVAGVSVEGGGIASGGTTLNGDLDMGGTNNILNANEIHAQKVSAVVYDYVTSVSHNIEDDEIIISKGGANEAKISTDATGVNIDKNTTVPSLKVVDTTLNKGSSALLADGLKVDNAIIATNTSQVDGGTTELATLMLTYKQTPENVDRIGYIQLSENQEAFRCIRIGGEDVMIVTDLHMKGNNEIHYKGTTVQALLDAKANQSTTYTKIETDNLLNPKITASSTDTLTNKTIDGNNNTLLNLPESAVPSNINATKIGAGTVDNTEFGYLDGVTSAIQGQIDNHTLHQAIDINPSGVGDSVVTFKHTANGDGTLLYCEACDAFEINKNIEIGFNDIKFGTTSLKDTIWTETIINSGGTSYDTTGSDGVWWTVDNPVAQPPPIPASLVTVDNICGCRFNITDDYSLYGQYNILAGMTWRRQPTDTTGGLTNTAGKKIYVECSVEGAGGDAFIYIVMRDCVITFTPDPFEITKHAFFEWRPQTATASNRLVRLTKTNGFGSNVSGAWEVVAGSYSTTPGVGQRLGILLDFAGDTIELYNASTGQSIASRSQAGSAEWAKVKGGTSSCRFAGGTRNQGDPHFRLYSEADSLYYPSITGTKEYYFIGPFGTGGGGGPQQTLDKNFYTITETNDLLAPKITADGITTLTNKTINGVDNTIINIGDAELTSGINANKIANGTVSNAEFQYLDGVTSGIQTQLNGKITSSSTDTLTNKTIDGNNNTLINIPAPSSQSTLHLTATPDALVTTETGERIIVRMKTGVGQNTDDVLYVTHSESTNGKGLEVFGRLLVQTAIELNGNDVQTQINNKIEASSIDTLTNKTIDYNNNTITNLPSTTSVPSLEFTSTPTNLVTTNVGESMIFRFKTASTPNDVMYLTHTDHADGLGAEIFGSLRTPAIKLNGTDLQTTLNGKSDDGHFFHPSIYLSDISDGVIGTASTKATFKILELGSSESVLTVRHSTDAGGQGIDVLGAVRVPAISLNGTDLQTTLDGKAGSTGVNGETFSISQWVSNLVTKKAELIMKGSGYLNEPASTCNILWDPANDQNLQINKNIKLNGTAPQISPSGIEPIKITSTLYTDLDAPTNYLRGNTIRVGKFGGGTTAIQEADNNLEVKTTGTNKDILIQANRTIDLQAGGGGAVNARNPLQLPNSNRSEVMTVDYARHGWEWESITVSASGSYNFGASFSKGANHWITDFEMYVNQGNYMVRINTSVNRVGDLGNAPSGTEIKAYFARNDGAGDINLNDVALTTIYRRPNRVRVDVGGDASWNGKVVHVRMRWDKY